MARKRLHPRLRFYVWDEVLVGEYAEMKEEVFAVVRRFTVRIPTTIGISGLLVFSGSGVVGAAGMHHGPAGPVPVTTLIKAPRVPFKFALGQRTFREKCSACHGQWAEGVAEKGPPLVHPYYRPGHHPDGAFYQAAVKGVKSHHWKFGDMPPVEGITKKDIAAILRFIRWWQEQNGIK